MEIQENYKHFSESIFFLKMCCAQGNFYHFRNIYWAVSVCMWKGNPGPSVQREGQACTDMCHASLSQEQFTGVLDSAVRANGATCWLLLGSARSYISAGQFFFSFREIRTRERLFMNLFHLVQLIPSLEISFSYVFKWRVRRRGFSPSSATDQLREGASHQRGSGFHRLCQFPNSQRRWSSLMPPSSLLFPNCCWVNSANLSPGPGVFLPLTSLSIINCTSPRNLIMAWRQTGRTVT